MKLLFLFFVCAIVFVAFQVWHTWRLIAVGKKLALEAVPFERVRLGAPTRILVIGDSTAVGTGATNNIFSIAGRLGVDFPEASVTNKGVNGMRTRELVGALQLIKKEKYDLIMIHIGGNDIVRFTNFDELATDIRKVLTLASGMSDSTLLVTSGDVGTSKLLPLGTRWLFSYRTRRVRDIFIFASNEANAHYVDIYGGHKQTSDPYREEPHVYYAADIFHPSDKGYENWYLFIHASLKEINLLPEKLKK